jgi:hypothetical protein
MKEEVAGTFETSVILITSGYENVEAEKETSFSECL